jgi:hypothetical protein
MVIRPEEIVPAYKFGHGEKIENVLEPNWWETEGKSGGSNAAPKKEEDDDDDDLDGIANGNGKGGAVGSSKQVQETKRVVARTRVSPLDTFPLIFSYSSRLMK